MDKSFQNINNLLVERRRLIIFMEYLSKKIGLVDDIKIKEILTSDYNGSRDKLQIVELELEKRGITLLDEDSTITFNKINEEINQLNSADNLIEWLNSKVTKKQLNHLLDFQKTHQKCNPKMTGKWTGCYISNKGFIPGEFSIGICQIGNKLIGFGALIGSIYSKAIVHGLIDHNEVRLEFSGVDADFTTYFDGSYEYINKISTIRGNYYVIDGSDSGVIESALTKDINTSISNRSRNLILISDLKKRIAYAGSNQLIQILEDIEGSFFEFQNESIFHKRRINVLSQNKRFQVLSFSESQLEESKITKDILDLLSAIESKLKIN